MRGDSGGAGTGGQADPDTERQRAFDRSVGLSRNQQKTRDRMEKDTPSAATRQEAFNDAFGFGNTGVGGMVQGALNAADLNSDISKSQGVANAMTGNIGMNAATRAIGAAARAIKSIDPGAVTGATMADEDERRGRTGGR